jgi:sulfhydrogenase subunit beta (sulfur reductase)
MSIPEISVGSKLLLYPDKINLLLNILVAKGYDVVGPTVRDNTIVYDHLESADALPSGWTDELRAGRYTLNKSDSKRIFGFLVGPHTWKRFLYPPRVSVWKAKKIKQPQGGFTVESVSRDRKPFAFFGVRPCDVAAIKVQDKVFSDGAYVDPHYTQNRKDSFIIAVNCLEPGETCFCYSMETGPYARSGFDILLTECINDSKHYFLFEIGTERGISIAEELKISEASGPELTFAEEEIIRSSEKFSRSVNTTGIKEMLYRNYENTQWDTVAARCFTCGNCTMVCPTCFCANIEDVTDLSGQQAERVRKWDSCYNLEFSYIHGGSVRPSEYSRYRHWLIHKFGTWLDQFDTSGCVGCGRCIVWCPAGIDITEELSTIRNQDK